MSKVDSLTVDRLRELVTYDRDTGIITRAVGPHKGHRVGCRNHYGYLVGSIANRVMLLHRVAWALGTGLHPTGVIDHINGDPSDNRLENLRDVNRRTNQENQRKARKDNLSSGLLGVRWHAPKQKWQARIHVGGRQKSLGYYLDKHEAHAVYLFAKRELHEGCTI